MSKMRRKKGKMRRRVCDSAQRLELRFMLVGAPQSGAAWIPSDREIGLLAALS